jgi:RNA-binding protein
MEQKRTQDKETTKNREKEKTGTKAISATERKSLLSKARSLDPILRLGKNGITDNILSEIETHLKKRKLIKLKMVKGFLEENDRKKTAQKIAEQTGSQLIEQTGFVIVLYKR